MASENLVILIGNLTRDPEMRVTPKGTAVTKFGLAVNRKFKGEDGAEREEVTFIDIEAWGKTAETIQKHCVKGRPLYVKGRLKLDQWEDKTTQQKRSKLKVVLENFQFIGGRGDGAPGGGGPGGDASEPASDGPSRGPSRAPSIPKDTVDEDVPF